MIELTRFDDGSDAVHGRLCVETVIADGSLQLTYRWFDWVQAPILGARAATAQRRDELWRRTCAEMFVALDSKAYSGGPYLEFNFSPTGDWAAYRFDSTRAGMRTHEWSERAVPQITVTAASTDVTLQVMLPLAALVAGSHAVAYASVVEASHGLSYWALRHPSDRPDFHHPESFAEWLEFPA